MVTVTITPSSVDNEILVIGNLSTDSLSAQDTIITLRLRRTNCTGTLVGVAQVEFYTSAVEYHGGGATGVDSPGTTSATTYALCAQASAISQAQGYGADITVMEVNIGADLAEIYNTNESNLVMGDLVSIDPSLNSGVKKSSKAYDKNIIGIVSTKPALVIGGGDREGQSAVPIALSGRVFARVTAENGSIKPGDLLTSSSIPGVAMKATKAGQVIGQAMTGFEGEGVGKVLAFVKNYYGNGAKLADLLPGLSQDGIQPPVSDIGKFALIQFISQKEQLATSVDLSEIVADRVAAGLEVITPKVVAKMVAADMIGPSQANDLSLAVGVDGQFLFNDANGKTRISFDTQGNATFSGILTADRIRANQIEGLEVIAGKFTTDRILSMISDRLASASAIPTASDSAVLGTSMSSVSVGDIAVDSAVVRLDMNVLGKLTAGGGLVVSGEAQFQGKTIFQALAEFIGNVIFHGDVSFLGRPTFNKDTAGRAVIAKGVRRVDVVFEKEYAQTPIVTASPVWELDQGILSVADQVNGFFIPKQDYVITSPTTKGFSIILDQPAVIDLTFNWTAIAVDNAVTFSSTSSAGLVPSPMPGPTQVATDSALVNQAPGASPMPSALPPTPTPTPTIVTPIVVASPTITSLPTITVLPNDLGFVRLREAPSVDSTEIGQLPVGQSYPYKQKQYNWYQVELEGKVGWVSGTYVEEK
jgi:hypothetical protein